MLYARCVGLAEDVAYPLKSPLFSSNKVTSKKSKELWTKGPKWNNATYEEKENYHYFIHLAQDYTPKKKKFQWGRQKKRRPTPGARKRTKEKTRKVTRIQI